jgi:hypothetical protein
VNTVMFSTAVVMCAAVRETHKADRSLLENEGRIVLGPSRVFRPTPGLCALFAKTGTRCSKTLSKNAQHYNYEAATLDENVCGRRS